MSLNHNFFVQEDELWDSLLKDNVQFNNSTRFTYPKNEILCLGSVSPENLQPQTIL